MSSYEPPKFQRRSRTTSRSIRRAAVACTQHGRNTFCVAEAHLILMNDIRSHFRSNVTIVHAVSELDRIAKRSAVRAHDVVTSLAWSVCLFITNVSSAKPPEPIKIPLGADACNVAWAMEPCIRWGRADPPTGRGTLRAHCTRHPLDNGHIQSSRPPNAMNNM